MTELLSTPGRAAGSHRTDIAAVKGCLGALASATLGVTEGSQLHGV
jgi:hypothetical protein